MPENKAPSPDGKYVFQIFPWEARMSLWIETPRLLEIASERIVFDGDANWSLDEAGWLDNERVILHLRRYPGDHSPSHFEVVVDCTQNLATIGEDSPIPLLELNTTLENLYRRSRTENHHEAPAPSSRLGGALKRFLRIFYKSY